MHLTNEDLCIFIQISLKFVQMLKGLIDMS